VERKILRFSATVLKANIQRETEGTHHRSLWWALVRREVCIGFSLLALVLGDLKKTKHTKGNAHSALATSSDERQFIHFYYYPS
jgi:hypothetical protein